MEPAATSSPRLGPCPPPSEAGEETPFSLLRLFSQLLQRLLPSSPAVPLFWLQPEAHAVGPEPPMPPGWGAPPWAVQHELRLVSSAAASSSSSSSSSSPLSPAASFVLGGAGQPWLPGVSWDEQLSEASSRLRSKFPGLLQPNVPLRGSPDPDSGYHSLEVEEPPLSEGREDGGQPCEGGEGSPAAVAEDSDIEEDLPVEARPACSNKLIDYILGGACSGEEEEEEEDDDDDGFDSEGSLSEPEAASPDGGSFAQLWDSFCTLDPYDLRNFTAPVQSAPERRRRPSCRRPEEVVEAATAEEEEDSSSWTESSSSGEEEEEEDWESGSADESENLKLWNSFCNVEDPYNPLNFTAQFQTAAGKCDRKGGPRGSQSSLLLSCQVHLVETRDSEATDTVKCGGVLPRETCKAKKRVTFLEEVIEYYISSEEDRKGPWEEFARDGCRFHKRIQETEKAIGYCFTMEHRQRILNRFQEGFDIS